MDDAEYVADKLGQEVEKVVQTVVTIVKALTGNLAFDKTTKIISLGWNPPEQYQITDGIYCSNCEMGFDLGLTVTFDIQEYQLLNFSFVVYGNAGAFFNLTAEAGTSFSGEVDPNLPALASESVTIMVGDVPINIQLIAPLQLKLNGTISTDYPLSTNGGVTINAQYGIQYTQSQGAQFINEFDHSSQPLIWNGPPGDVQVAASLGLLCSLYAKIEFIGGPQLGFQPSLKSVLVASPENPAYCRYPVSLSWGLDVTVGASVNITVGGLHIYSHTWTSNPIYSKTGPIASYCEGQNEISDIAVKPLFPTVVYFGNRTVENPNCHGAYYVPTQMSLQYAYQAVIEKQLVDLYVMKETGIWDTHGINDGLCTVQGIFTATAGRTPGSFVFSPHRRPNGDEYSWQMCAAGTSSIFLTEFEGSFSEDWSTFTGFSIPYHCTIISLTKEV